MLNIVLTWSKKRVKYCVKYLKTIHKKSNKFKKK